jgi:hypothetical protein
MRAVVSFDGVTVKVYLQDLQDWQDKTPLGGQNKADSRFRIAHCSVTRDQKFDVVCVQTRESDSTALKLWPPAQTDNQNVVNCNDLNFVVIEQNRSTEFNDQSSLIFLAE